MRGGFDAAKTLLENVHLMTLAVSLGGVDTLIGPFVLDYWVIKFSQPQSTLLR